MSINLLEPRVYNRISAGEVVERPASIVKELVENSIDAGATAITISIENGGISKIEVSDNGSGIDKNDLTLAFTPHATSKIKEVEDLDAIASLGFRGEALASIASVCHVYLTSKPHEQEVGYSIAVDGGEFGQIKEVARTSGTSITCKDLFFNTPARAKFLRKPKSEEGEVTHLVEKFMLSHPEISFTYYIDNKQVYNTISSSMQDIIYTIYGREVYDCLIPVDYTENGLRIKGYVTKPKISKSNRTYQTLFVNGRYVENYLISQAVQGIYESFLMKGRFPIYVLNLIVPKENVDVNVHPSKKEVKFDNTNYIFGFVRRAVEKALLSVDQIANFVSSYDENDEKNGQELSNPYNAQGFNPFIKPKEILSATEGSSYRTVDHFDKDAKLVSDEEVSVQEYTKAPPKPLPPDFQNLTLEEKEIPVNKKGGPFFFDLQTSNTVMQIKSENNLKQMENKFLSASVKEEMQILGTIFKTYIVVECQDSIYFIDQHAAHERLLYNKLLENVNEKNVAKQTLLAPYSFAIGPKESETLEESVRTLNKMGFEISNTGGFSYEVKAVPLVLSNISLADFVDEVVKEGINLERKPSEFIHDKLCQSACKHAIKAGDTVSKEECAYIIEQVRKGVMLCPHGRPICLEMTRHEFEKLFKRIV